MAKWPGGLDPMEVQRGFDAIRDAKSMDDLLEAIDKVPVLRSPVFHTILNANADADKASGLAQFIDNFFMALAIYVYMAHCRNAVAPATTGGCHAQHDHWPPFYKAVCEQLNGKVPENYPHYLEPSRDIERLVFEIEEVTKGHAALPDYSPTEGSTWSVVVVLCATCRVQRIEVFTNRLDLTVASNLLPAVRDGRINDALCPRCGQARCYPIRVWIREESGPADTVAALSGILRLEEGSWVYLPPPGTPREARDERLYESRATSMFRDFTWKVHSKNERSAVPVSMRVAYGKEDLIRMAEEILTNQSRSELPVDIPSSMKALWDAAARNMRSGLWPVVEASKIVADALSEGGKDWPLLLDLPLDPLETHRRLALCFIREGLAERSVREVPIRLKVKLDTFTALLQKGQLGLADAKLRETQDLLGEMPASSPDREFCERLGQLCRVELLDAQGKSLDASHLETTVLDTLPRPGRSIETDILDLKVASAKALEAKHEGRWLDALKALRKCVLDWSSLIDCIPDPTAASQKLVEACVISLSSDGANLANVLTAFRSYVKALRIIKQLAENVPPSDEDRLWMAQMASTVKVAPDVMDDAAFDELEDFLGAAVSEKRLWDRSLDLLQQSLSLSARIQAWELAAIQAHNTALLLFEGKVFDQAEIFMRRAVEYAERVGDDIRIIQGYGLLARLASKRGAAEETIELATKAIETYARNLLSRGYTARPNLGLQRLLTRLVLEAVSVGGAREKAVVLVENLKSLTLVNSLFSDRPDQPGDADSSLRRDTTDDLAAEHLEEVRLQAIFAADPQRSERETGDLEKTIRESVEQQSLRDPRFRQWVDSSDFALTTVAGLRQRLCLLGDRTTFLGVVFDGIDLWTYALWSDGCEVLKATLQDEDWPSSGEPVTDLERLSRLGEALLKPLIGQSALLAARDHLVFSLCPELYALPVAALPWRGGRLIESVIVDVVQGAGVFEACIRRPFNRLDSLLCLGNPSRPDLPPLKGAEDEVKLLESQFGARGKSVKLLLRHKATAPAFLDSAGDYDICHMACHGEFLETGGRLKLAPDIARKDSGELTELRILTEVRIRPGALVNLAGCSTAVQRETGVVIIGGLVPVWMLSGASGVVASLWPIQDDLAQALQQQLYRYVLDGSRPDEALALTQRDCIAGKLAEAMSHPDLWAAFQFYGCLVPNMAEGFL